MAVAAEAEVVTPQTVVATAAGAEVVIPQTVVAAAAEAEVVTPQTVVATAAGVEVVMPQTVVAAETEVGGAAAVLPAFGVSSVHRCEYFIYEQLAVWHYASHWRH